MSSGPAAHDEVATADGARSTAGAAAGHPGHPVLGPLGATGFFAAVAVLLALQSAAFAILGHGGGAIPTSLIGVGAAGVAVAAERRRRSRPVVVVGTDGVWLAPVGVLAERLVPWDEVHELVCFRVTERQVFRSGPSPTRAPALGVRLRVAPPVPAHEQRELDRLFGPLAGEHAALRSGTAATLALPYRLVARSALRHRDALVAAVRHHAPRVAVVDGPPLSVRYAWRPGTLPGDPSETPSSG